MMPNIGDFTLRDMVEISAALRSMGSGAARMDDAADKIVRYLYENLTDQKTGERNCVLVRFFLTRTYGELDREHKEFARKLLSEPPESPSMKCLVLMATAGAEPAWNSPKTSRGHKVIPLESERFIEAVPMVWDIIRQMGLDVKTLLRPDPSVVMDMATTTYDVACIPDAVGNPNIPAQNDFVIPYGVRSEIGLGGILPSGNLFVIIVFTRVSVTRQIADMFKPLTLSVKVAVLPLDGTTPGGAR
jgi:hypothetical protein